MSLALFFSIFISSLKVCSFNLIFNSSSFCFSFSSLIFSNLSCSCLSNFNLLTSSFLTILYWSIAFAILSKNAWIYFSKLKFILKFISGFKEFWKLIILRIKFSFLGSLDLKTFFIFFEFDLMFFTFLLLGLIFFTFLLLGLNFLPVFFLIIFFVFFFCFFHFQESLFYQ